MKSWRQVRLGAGLALLLAGGVAGAAPQDRLADRYSWRLWGREQDFPDTRIRALDFDEQGRLWLATPQGMARFDGVRFNVVTNLPPGIAPVRGWLPDAGGTPWVFGVGGVAHLTRTGWQKVGAQAVGPVHVQAVFTNATGGLWLVGEKTLWFYQHGKLTRVEWPPGMGEDARITSAALDAGQVVWLVVEGRLLAFHEDHWLSEEEARIGHWEHVALVRAEDHGTLVVVEREGLHVRRGGRWRNLPLPPPAVAGDAALLRPTAVLEEANGNNIWLGTAHALYRWSRGTWLNLTDNDIGVPLAVNVLELDRYGDVWAGLDSGLLCLHRRAVTMLRTGEAAQDEPITCLFALAAGQVWAGIKERGLWVVRRNGLEPLELPLKSNQTVTAVAPGEGGWWVGTHGDGLFWMTTTQLVPVASTTAPGSQTITALQRTRDGRLWVGTWAGLYWLPAAAPGTGQQPELRGVPGGQKWNVTALAVEGTGTLWVATAGQGPSRLEPDGTLHYFGERDGVPPTALLCLQADRDGRLWAGCARGLIRWDGQRWQACDLRKDFIVRHLYHDDRGRLWCGTAQGLHCLRPDAVRDALAQRSVSGRYFRMGAADGLPAAECVAQVSQAVTSAGNELFLATPDGVARLSLNIAQTGRRPQAMDIETVSAVGRLLWNRLGCVPGEPLPGTPLLKLPPGSEPVTFEYAMPELFWPDRIRYDYQWKLEGLNEAWSPATTEPRVTFEQLPPGDYSFRVRGRREGDWCEVAQPVRLRVLPFFWQALWFRAVVAALALVTTVLVAWRLLRARYRRRLLRAQQAQALAQERTRIAQDLHDEMGAGLTEISLLGDLATTEAHGPTRTENISLLTQRARALVTKLDEIVWAVNPRHDRLEAVSDFFGSYAQQFLRPAGIACALEVAEALPELPLEARVRHQLFLAFKEALTNLVRHSGATQARLRIAVEAGGLTISVSDNGRGLKAEGAAGLHDGLRSMCARLEKLGGACEVASPAGGGVTVLLRLPLKTEKPT